MFSNVLRVRSPVPLTTIPLNMTKQQATLLKKCKVMFSLETVSVFLLGLSLFKI